MSWCFLCKNQGKSVASLSTMCGGSRIVVFGSLFGVSWVMPHSVWKVIVLEGTFWKEK